MLRALRHDHDAAKEDATRRASMVADRAPRVYLTPSKATSRAPVPSTVPFSSRRDDAQLPKFSTSCIDVMSSETTGRARSHSRSSISSVSSSSNMEHSPLIARSAASAHSSPKSPFHSRSATATVFDLTRCATAPEHSLVPVPLTLNTLSPRARKRLMRSTRKLSKVLGETPIVMSPMLGQDDVYAVEQNFLTPIDAEFGVLRLPIAKNSGTPHKYRSAGRHLTLNLGSNAQQTRAQTLPARHPAASQSSISVPATGRSPDLRGLPVLKLDCSSSGGSGKRSRLSANGPSSDENDADNMSVISTMTADTIGSLPPIRSPLSPVSVHNNARMKRDELEARRTKMAKLSRTLGETVPAELVFPPGSSPSAKSPLSSVSALSPIGNLTTLFEHSSVSDLEKQISENDSDLVLPPPRKSSLLRRRRRMSLQLESVREAETSGSGVGTVAPSNTPVSNARRGVTRSQSVRGRGTSKYAVRSNRLGAPTTRSHAATIVKSLGPTRPWTQPEAAAEVAAFKSDDEATVSIRKTRVADRASTPSSSSSQRSSIIAKPPEPPSASIDELIVPQNVSLYLLLFDV